MGSFFSQKAASSSVLCLITPTPPYSKLPGSCKRIIAGVDGGGGQTNFRIGVRSLVEEVFQVSGVSSLGRMCSRTQENTVQLQELRDFDVPPGNSIEFRTAERRA